MTLLYLNKNNKFKIKKFKKQEKMTKFISKKNLMHFYIDGFWVIR